MANSTTGRVTIVTTLVAGAMLAATAIAFACVPQRGGIKAENVEDGADHEGSKSSTTGTSDGFIVGDGNSNTKHFGSWCGADGGHPTEAVYAEDGDDIEVTLREAKKDEVATGCPDNDNKLPHAGTETAADIWVEDGENTGDSDVYQWNDSEGIWDFQQGDGVGCYFEDENDPSNDADPHHQGTVDIDSDGDGSKTFALNAMNANDWAQPGGDTRQSNEDPADGDGAALLCVGTDADKDGDNLTVADEHKAIFAPIVITEL